MRSRQMHSSGRQLVVLFPLVVSACQKPALHPTEPRTLSVEEVPAPGVDIPGDGSGGSMGSLRRVALGPNRWLYLRSRTFFHSTPPDTQQCLFAFEPMLGLRSPVASLLAVSRETCDGRVVLYRDGIVALTGARQATPEAQTSWPDPFLAVAMPPSTTIWLRVGPTSIEHLRGPIAP